jgi:hypothetical protein
MLGAAAMRSCPRDKVRARASAAMHVAAKERVYKLCDWLQ